MLVASHVNGGEQVRQKASKSTLVWITGVWHTFTGYKMHCHEIYCVEQWLTTAVMHHWLSVLGVNKKALFCPVAFCSLNVCLQVSNGEGLFGAGQVWLTNLWLAGWWFVVSLEHNMSYSWYILVAQCTFSHQLWSYLSRFVEEVKGPVGQLMAAYNRMWLRLLFCALCWVVCNFFNIIHV